MMITKTQLLFALGHHFSVVRATGSFSIELYCRSKVFLTACSIITIGMKN